MEEVPLEAVVVVVVSCKHAVERQERALRPAPETDQPVDLSPHFASSRLLSRVLLGFRRRRGKKSLILDVCLGLNAIS